MTLLRYRQLFVSLLLIGGNRLLQAQEDEFQKDANLPACMKADEIPKYHTASNVCHRDLKNSIRNKQVRATRYHQLLEDGVNHIPDEQTAYCPEVVEDWEISDCGHDTRFIFENVASSPVVVIFVFRGIEYSAISPPLSPPHHDSKAILPPGEWAVISAFEGHVFRARELLPNGEMGRILVQHQPGLIPIKNRYGHYLDCEDQQDFTAKHDSMEGGRGNGNLRASFDHCNVLHKGFRNTLAGCSINVFNSANEQPVDGPMKCQEEFKFHLGISPCPDDYMITRESRMKFHPTYIGETWVARLESNTDIVVDSYTVEPVYIRDCPNFPNDATETVNNTVSSTMNKIYEERINLLRANLGSYV